MEDLYLANCDYYSKEDNCKKIENVKSLLIQGEPLDEPPLISIVIPTFKRFSTLKGTIESAINQKGSHHYNIIVVDNNSERNDETEVFMREYAASYPTVLYYKNEQNIGMGGNWCRCMELADGKWVILIHDDDLLIEDYLNEIEPCLSDNIDGIFVMSSVFEDGKPLPRIQNPNQMRLFKKSIKDQYHFPSLGPSGNILKKSTVIELGCFDKDIFAPDAFFSKMAYYGNVYTTNKKLIYYRIGINESTKLSAMDKMCYQNHFHRIQTFEKLGIPKFIIKRLLLYSDIIFEKPFQTSLNKDFKYSSMSQYTAKEVFISKLFYKPVDFFLKISRKIFHKTIIVNLAYMNKDLIIESYGIRLVRLTEDKIELVRQWRNNPKISQYMEFREYITVDMQKKWFKKISNDNNFFFLVVVNNKEIGLVDIKDIDYVRNCGESGIFLWDDSFLGKQISYRSLLALHDFAFDTLHLSLLISHILDDNVRSQKSYMSLGFVLNEEQEGVKLQKYTLTREEHECARPNIVSKLKPLMIS